MACQKVCKQGRDDIIGASLSEPHTSGTALRKCVNIRTYVRPCLLAAIYRKFQMSTFKYFTKIDLMHEACYKQAIALPTEVQRR